MKTVSLGGGANVFAAVAAYFQTVRHAGLYGGINRYAADRIARQCRIAIDDALHRQILFQMLQKMTADIACSPHKNCFHSLPPQASSQS